MTVTVTLSLNPKTLAWLDGARAGKAKMFGKPVSRGEYIVETLEMMHESTEELVGRLVGALDQADKAAERLEKQLREGVPLGTGEGERVEAYEDDPDAPEPPLRKRLRELENALDRLWRAGETLRTDPDATLLWDALCEALGEAERVLGMPAEDQGDASELEKARAIHAQHPTSAISTDGTPTTIRDVLEQATR